MTKEQRLASLELRLVHTTVTRALAEGKSLTFTHLFEAGRWVKEWYEERPPTTTWEELADLYYEQYARPAS